jgi:hypothetical protein
MINVDPRRPRGIVWIASSPKSGNTWMRMFLYQLMRIMGGHPREADELNKLDRSSMSEARLYGLFQQALGKPLDSATETEVTRVRQHVHATIAERVNNIALVKTHNVLGEINDMPIINTSVSVGAIYFVRDPRDVASSLAKLLGASTDEAIRVLGRNGYSSRNSEERPNTLDALSAFRARERFSILPSAFTRPARWATPIKVPAVSNMCTNRNASTTLIMLMLNTPATSMAIQVGARLGGADMMPS